MSLLHRMPLPRPGVAGPRRQAATLRACLAGVLAGLPLLCVSPANAVEAGAVPDFQPGVHVHALPRHAAGDDAAGVLDSNHFHNGAVTRKPKAPVKTLTYYGGPVMANIAVEQVLWGSGTYLPQVTGTVTPNIATFYQAVLTSPLMDLLAQYPSTTANLGHGTYNGSVSVTPSAAANGSTITDAQIQAELTAQILAGKLPAPTANSYYAVFFPKGKTITQGGTSSCTAGGFCAYHGTFVLNGLDVTYGVHPDTSAGSGCDVGCGTSSVSFNNLTSVASHELAETATDPAVGLATVYAAPLGWYNQTFGEIGDICNGQQGTMLMASGVTYTLQKEWSNKAGACVVQ